MPLYVLYNMLITYDTYKIFISLLIIDILVCPFPGKSFLNFHYSLKAFKTLKRGRHPWKSLALQFLLDINCRELH